MYRVKSSSPFIRYWAQCDPIATVEVVCCPTDDPDKPTLECGKQYGSDPDSKHFRSKEGDGAKVMESPCGDGKDPLDPAKCKALTTGPYPETSNQCFIDNDCTFLGRIESDDVAGGYPKTESQNQPRRRMAGAGVKCLFISLLTVIQMLCVNLFLHYLWCCMSIVFTLINSRDCSLESSRVIEENKRGKCAFPSSLIVM